MNNIKDSHDVFNQMVQSHELKRIFKDLSTALLIKFIDQHIQDVKSPSIGIIGGSGSGKSTFATFLGHVLDTSFVFHEDNYHKHTRQWRRKMFYSTKDPTSVIDYYGFKHDVKELCTSRRTKPLIIEGTNKPVLSLCDYSLTLYFHTSDVARYLLKVKRRDEKFRLLPGETLIGEFLKRLEIEHFPSTLPCIKETDYVVHIKFEPFNYQFKYDIYERII